MTVTDDIEITVARRLKRRLNKIWCEDLLEQDGFLCIKDYDSISQEEIRRFVDFGVIDAEGYITKRFPLPRIFIRPRTSI